MKYLIFLITCIALSQTAIAAKLPWEDSRYTHYSEEEPLKNMLESMASSEGTKIVVSPKITDIVSVYFKEKTPLSILKSLADSNKLMWYFDGEVLYVYKNDEVQTGSVTLKKISVQEFSAALKKIGILDDQFYWNEVEEQGIVYFKGPERFVSAVLQMSEILDNKKPEGHKVFKWKDSSGRTNYSNINPEKGGSSVSSDIEILTKDNLYLGE